MYRRDLEHCYWCQQQRVVYKLCDAAPNEVREVFKIKKRTKQVAYESSAGGTQGLLCPVINACFGSSPQASCVRYREVTENIPPTVPEV